MLTSGHLLSQSWSSHHTLGFLCLEIGYLRTTSGWPARPFTLVTGDASLVDNLGNDRRCTWVTRGPGIVRQSAGSSRDAPLVTQLPANALRTAVEAGQVLGPVEVLA